jgi:two-component system response regulator AtoC
METILIVEDDKDMQFILSNILNEEGYKSIICGTGSKAIQEVKKGGIDVVLLDFMLPEMNGMAVLEKIREINKDISIIMLTAYGGIRDAVKAMKLGAFDYITKPFDSEELIIVIKKALKTRDLSKEVQRLRKKLERKEDSAQVIGQSPQIERVLKQVDLVARTEMTVIIQGDSGTGKELIANLIHQKSPRKNKSFIAVDCGAIPETLIESEFFGFEKGAFTGAEQPKEGIFEQANGGTLFLDEVANLPQNAQAKLLRAVQERRIQHLGGKGYKQIDIRIIVATNSDLFEAVRQNKYRKDLYHRLNEFVIVLPPLKEREEDISILANHFLMEANQEFNKKVNGFTGDAVRFLLNYTWPGNVRELKNVVRRAALLANSSYIGPAELITNNSELPDDKDVLQLEIGNEASLKSIMNKKTRQIEEDVIKQALIKSGGNKSKAAKLLNITRTTLYSKIKEFNLE